MDRNHQGSVFKKSKIYIYISKYIEISGNLFKYIQDSKSSSNRPKISINFMEFLDSSVFLLETMVHIATPGCTDPWHLQLRVLPLFHIQRQDEQLDQAGQRPRCLNWCFSTMGVLPKSGGVIFCIEIWLFSNMFHVKIEGFLSCESASWSSEWLTLEPPSHFWNHKTTRTTCIIGVTTITALHPEELKKGQTSWVGWYSLKRNHAAAAIQRWSSAIFCHRVSQAEVVSVGSNM